MKNVFEALFIGQIYREAIDNIIQFIRSREDYKIPHLKPYENHAPLHVRQSLTKDSVMILAIRAGFPYLFTCNATAYTIPLFKAMDARFYSDRDDVWIIVSVLGWDQSACVFWIVRQSSGQTERSVVEKNLCCSWDVGQPR